MFARAASLFSSRISTAYPIGLGANLAALAAFLLFTSALSTHAQDSKGREGNTGDWQASASRVVITPDAPIWMGGYAARKAPSEGKIHDLYAKVLVFQDARGKRAAIVTLDLLSVTPSLREQIARGAARAEIGDDALLVNASHTHCGPELRDERLMYFGIGAEYAAKARKYVQQTAEKIAQAIVDGANRMKPVELVYSHARAGFAMNRRLPTDNGFINSPNPDGPVDHSVPVLQVRSQDDRLLAVLFGYACHNTTLSFQQLCGDYAGFAQAYLEESHPGTVAMFVNGCSADQNPYPRRTLELAQQHGRALANGVETALETKAIRVVRGPLRMGLTNVTLQFATPPTVAELERQLKSSNKYERYHAQWLLDQHKREGKIADTYDGFPVQTFRFGDDLTLIALCGESVVDYSLRLKREVPSLLPTADGAKPGEVWVAGYSNHVFGYLPSERVLAEGGYEGGGAMRYTGYPGPFAQGVEERIVGAVLELLQRPAKAANKK